MTNNGFDKTTELQATPIYKISDTIPWLEGLKNKDKEFGLFYGSSVKDEYIKVGKIHVKEDGILTITYSAWIGNGNKEIDLKLCYDGKPDDPIPCVDNNGSVYAEYLKAGDYALYTKEVCQQTGKVVQAQFGAMLYSGKNDRIIDNDAIYVCTSGGRPIYQKFQVSKRGIDKIYVDSTNLIRGSGKDYTTFSIQKKIGDQWKTVAQNVQVKKVTFNAIDKDKYESPIESTRAEIEAYKAAIDNGKVKMALDAGTYRVVVNASSGDLYAFVNESEAAVANSTFGTSKKKAKTIKLHKTKKQVFLSNDSNKKAHWYKIKIKKKRKVRIDITGLENGSNIAAKVSVTKQKTRKSKSRSKLKINKTSKRIRISGKAAKGTYYIKVTKNSLQTLGYKVQYLK